MAISQSDYDWLRQQTSQSILDQFGNVNYQDVLNEYTNPNSGVFRLGTGTEDQLGRQFRSNILGRDVQVSNLGDGQGYSFNFTGDGNRDGYTTVLRQGQNGGSNLFETERGNGDMFLADMAKFAAAATGMYGGLNALAGLEAGAGAAGASSGSGSSLGSGAAGGGESLGSGLSLNAGGATGITGSVAPSGAFVPGAGTGVGMTTAGASSGAMGSLAPGYFGAETAALSAAGGAAGAAAGSATGASGTAGTTGAGAATTGAAAPATGAGTGATAATSGGGLLSNVLQNPLTATVAGAALSAAAGGASRAGDQTITTRQQIDPRMERILYGENGQGGFINNNILSQLNNPQAPGMQSFGGAADNYLGYQGYQDLQGMRDAAGRLQNSNINAPSMNAASVANTPGMQAALASSAQINAPGQNNLNLSPAYQDMVYGQAGNNPYLTGAIGRGINQSRNAFSDMLTDATRNITQSVLPSIRSGAVINGAMGSSRQGIAEGNALQDYNTQVTRAMERFGQGNTDAAVAAQSGAYDADRNRALNAMSGLGAQQYGVASQNAQMQQQTNLANAGFQNQANQTNYQGLLQSNLANAGYQQGANQANLGSQLSTNQLNSANQQAGISAGSGLLNQTYGYGTNQDAYNLNRTSQVSGLLAPYTGLGGSSTQTQPLYQNTAGNILGGAATGLGLWNAARSAGLFS